MKKYSRTIATTRCGKRKAETAMEGLWELDVVTNVELKNLRIEGHLQCYGVTRRF
ncbi:MAG: hypothetical protein IPO94_10190 [Saprospiraceae bacterium]|nr:hypothetical protein [Saprospiraceae bacterium]